MRVEDLKAGDEVLGFMRMGLALRVGRTAKGHLFRYVPSAPCPAKTSDIQRFAGTVISNDTENKILRVNTTNVSARGIPLNNESPPLNAEISYTALRRLVMYSKVSFEPKEGNLTFPANFESTKFRPYKTMTEVKLR